MPRKLVTTVTGPLTAEATPWVRLPRPSMSGNHPHEVVTEGGLHSNDVPHSLDSPVMAAPVEQVGVIVACPACGTDVLQKTMIPLGVVDGVISYVCVPCARKLVTTGNASE